ncbi:PA2778 family cysteine peptidase [Rivibacter subsaxonicus]|uniref:Tetratricopeptide repeat protein n=1 Tax=Rivibacter subsaxonicus TaxID=457575 RepID=A0A4Q7W1J6_9BURK|nr:PA2778 family cysteine peptidase [Rivibacter subsaxonicus]RZU03154.1 hypothetical protein EV670_1187 [Rivibacter subsaxonicus]
MQRLLAALASTAAAWLLAGCAGVPLAGPEQVAPVAELSRTPHFAQQERQCGPAVLATLLASAGVRDAGGATITPQTLEPEVYLPARGGSLQIEMLAAARRHGAFAVPVPGTVAAVADELRAGHPVAVLLNLGLPVAPLWHYAVVVGVEDGGARLVLRSGASERMVMSRFTFEQTWARSGRWAFVATVVGDLPVAADEAALVAAAVAFERAAPAAEAVKAYAAVVARHPGNLTAAIGLGNARAAAGDVAGAIVAFEAAARRFDSAPAWINLAQLRLERGDVPGAADAAERALRRSREDEPRWADEAAAVVAAATLASRPGQATR